MKLDTVMHGCKKHHTPQSTKYFNKRFCVPKKSCTTQQVHLNTDVRRLFVCSKRSTFIILYIFYIYWDSKQDIIQKNEMLIFLQAELKLRSLCSPYTESTCKLPMILMSLNLQGYAVIRLFKGIFTRHTYMINNHTVQ